MSEATHEERMCYVRGALSALDAAHATPDVGCAVMRELDITASEVYEVRNQLIEERKTTPFVSGVFNATVPST